MQELNWLSINDSFANVISYGNMFACRAKNFFIEAAIDKTRPFLREDGHTFRYADLNEPSNDLCFLVALSKPASISSRTFYYAIKYNKNPIDFKYIELDVYDKIVVVDSNSLLSLGDFYLIEATIRKFMGAS